MKKIIHAVLASAFIFTGHSALAATDNEILEARLQKVAPKDKPLVQGLTTESWETVLQRFIADQPKGGTKCVDSRTERLAGKYEVSYTADGQPCRIYDLSFPTLETLFAKRAVTTLPVQGFSARDYLNWMNGNYQAVVDKINGFPASLGRGETEGLAGWVKRVEFKQDRINGLLAAATVKETGLPAQFSAADLELGNRFQFSAQEKARLKEALAIGAKAGPNGLALLSAQDQASWQEAIERPESLLEKIKFNWDDARKVYDVFVEGEFLPVRGPIALVDYSMTYKLAVERTLRSLVQSALEKLVQFVPGQAQRIVSVVLTDTFMFINTAYDYQLNQLEGTLRKAQNSQLSLSLDANSTERGMNILFGGKSDLITAYMMSVIQKKKFDWNQFEEAGRKARYTAEKQREIMLTNMHSRMVQNDGCSIEIVEGYFGLCTKNNTHNLHSMISEHKILFWNLGGPMMYQYEMPSGVTLKRSASYVLSVGAGMFDLPIVKGLMGYLATQLKGYATAGITDQAFLHNSLYLQKQAGSIGEKDQAMLGWMYLQNINPFLPKTADLESRIINANAALLRR